MVRTAVVGALAGSLVAIAGVTWVNESIAQGGYDAYGYDYSARRFSQLYENADRDLHNNTGDQTRLRMQWREQFNLQNPELSDIPKSYNTTNQSCLKLFTIATTCP